MASNRPPKVELDTSLLSEDDKELLRLAAEEELLEEEKKRQKDAFLQEAKREARRKIKPDEALRPLVVDLPPYCDRIMIDGTIYLHGAFYELTKAEFDTLTEVMSRTWQHQSEVIDGVNSNAYRKPRGVVMRPGMETINTSKLLRV